MSQQLLFIVSHKRVASMVLKSVIFLWSMFSQKIQGTKGKIIEEKESDIQYTNGKIGKIAEETKTKGIEEEKSKRRLSEDYSYQETKRKRIKEESTSDSVSEESISDSVSEESNSAPVTQFYMEKEDDEHTAESVESNSSQNQSIKKHTAGKRKRETDTDSSACSFIMVHPKCPCASENGHQMVALASNMYRFGCEADLDADEIKKQKGKLYWDHITSLVNQEKRSFTRDMVLTMAENIETFHANHDCDCIGKSLSRYLQDRGPPNLPSREERAVWNLYDKRIVHTEFISKSSMTSDDSNKRICVRTEVNPQPSEVPPLEELCRAPHVRAESNGEWVIRMMNHYDFPSDIKSMLGAKLLDNPSMFPLIVGFDEKTLLSFIRGVSDDGLFNTWYMEWTARNRS